MSWVKRLETLLYHTALAALTTMTPALDDTCDPTLTSWVRSANLADSDFPLQNLPLGVVRRTDARARSGIGVAIGDRVLDVGACAEAGLLHTLPPAITAAVRHPSLQPLFTLGSTAVGLLRRSVHGLLRADSSPDQQNRVAPHLFTSDACELPLSFTGFTDFFASLHHATRVARLRQADAGPPTHYGYAPLGYHGRAGSIVVSGTPIARPRGPRRTAGTTVFAATERLDYEAEIGWLLGGATPLGTTLSVHDARAQLVGACLVNDWSARDVQSFESQPLGPFLSKSFATSVSPWVVTRQALEPFRVAPSPRPRELPSALPHLLDEQDQSSGAWTITLAVWLTSQTMREMDIAPVRLSTADARSLFWTPAQLVAHYASNGGGLRAGDLLGTGTISGPEPGTLGCLLEMTRGGREPLTLPTGETRGYLGDGDEITIQGWCEAPGARRIGFGECRGLVLPALPPSSARP